VARNRNILSFAKSAGRRGDGPLVLLRGSIMLQLRPL
jgi:hypothetical protein